MNQKTIVAAAAILTLFVSFRPAQAQTHESSWEPSIYKAVDDSREHGRPIMLVFSGSDWCSWCQQLEAEVFETLTFESWSKNAVVKTMVDSPRGFDLPAKQAKQNKFLKKRFGDFVQSYPTVLFVRPDGSVIGKTGYVQGGPDVWISSAKAILETERLRVADAQITQE